MKSKIITLLIVIFAAGTAYSSQFDELDKPPEGAHQGQMLLGGIMTMGMPLGGIISGEEDFLSGTSYELGSGSWKELMVSHLAFDFGIFFEYMPIDHLGARVKVKKTVIIQRTIFGSEYENWSRALYSNYSFYLGPTYHLTTRKQWDVTCTAYFGYSIANFSATPIATKLITAYAGNGDQSLNGFALGAELNFTAYFSGGLFISLGCDWNLYFVSFDSFNLTNPKNSATYLSGETSSNIHTISFAISAGYAFAN
ncbi:MAG: hypothetical protein GY754_29560 [bacterium]|nr:hypothetical protein [bacterium]